MTRSLSALLCLVLVAGTTGAGTSAGNASQDEGEGNDEPRFGAAAQIELTPAAGAGEERHCYVLRDPDATTEPKPPRTSDRTVLDVGAPSMRALLGVLEAKGLFDARDTEGAVPFVTWRITEPGREDFVVSLEKTAGESMLRAMMSMLEKHREARHALHFLRYSASRRASVRD